MHKNRICAALSSVCCQFNYPPTRPCQSTRFRYYLPASGKHYLSAHCLRGHVWGRFEEPTFTACTTVHIRPPVSLPVPVHSTLPDERPATTSPYSTSSRWLFMLLSKWLSDTKNDEVTSTYNIHDVSAIAVTRLRHISQPVRTTPAAAFTV